MTTSASAATVSSMISATAAAAPSRVILDYDTIRDWYAAAATMTGKLRRFCARNLQAGVHKITVDMCELGGGEVLKMRYDS